MNKENKSKRIQLSLLENLKYQDALARVAKGQAKTGDHLTILITELKEIGFKFGIASETDNPYIDNDMGKII